MKVALVTYQDQGKYASSVENEDEKLLAFLQQKGLTIEFAIWNDPHVDWQQYDLAVLKSPWDYFDKISLFYQWLDRLKSLKVRLLNPYQTVRWNADKHYLSDIAQAGLPVTPSLFLEKGQKSELPELFEKLQAQKLIIKPCVSGGARHTYAFTRHEAAQLSQVIDELLTEEAFLVQPFLAEIQTQGEWSFVFFHGKFSHCLLKKAKPGDFRVQHYLGGTIHTENLPSSLLNQAMAYVEKFAGNCLYARVDGVAIDERFVLMELELIEPFLFLFTHPQSYENYYQALQELL
jgi:glutathione synthase/RimK-type ligase-like ATP-grasp enzyme